MQAKNLLDSKAAQYAVFGVVGLLAAWFVYRKLGDVLNAVNPLNRDNVIARGVNDIGGAITNDENFTLGGWIYDVTHPTYDPNAPTPKAPAPVEDQPWWQLIANGW
jgi:hypothetical protein